MSAPAARPARDGGGVGASIVVAALGTALGTILLSATGYISGQVGASEGLAGSATVNLVLGLLTALLLAVSLYVSAIVTANTFATVVAGRTRRIALLRLLGSPARTQRSAIAREGLASGAIGAAIGLISTTLLLVGGIPLAEAVYDLPRVGYVVPQLVLLLPPVAVVFTTWAAAWVGSIKVISVTPLQAIAASVDAGREEVSSRTVRNGGALVLLILGALLLAGGVVAGSMSPFGVIIAFLGGLLSFSGIVLGATLLIPPLLRSVGALFGRSAPARLAAQNAVRYPERSSRTAIGVVIGVTLVTMFAVAAETVKAILVSASGDRLPPEFTQVLDVFATVMMILVGVSAVIAGVGMVNLLTLSVVQRRRELGLLRALGVSRGQVRSMVVLEAVHIAATAVVAGLILGTLYGWAGAEATLGSIATVPGGTAMVPPAIPIVPVLAVVVVATAVTIIGCVVPTRLATRISPVAALAQL